MISKKFQIAILCVIFSSYLQAESILCDLGGVLINTDKVTVFRSLGLLRLCKYLLQNPRITTLGSHLRTRLFAFLKTIQESSTISVTSYDETGQELPPCMCDWLAGKIPSEQLLIQIAAKAEQDKTFFKNSLEKDIILAIIKIMFEPDQFIKSRKLNKAALNYLKACKKAGHSLYILSNWDAHSFDILQERFPELKDLFDGAVTSGQVGTIKPDKAIYQTVLSKYQLNPDDTLFLDDRPENVQAAQELGINTILCTPDKTSTFDTIYDETNDWLDSRSENPATEPIVQN